MNTRTLEISNDELAEVTRAYQVLQKFLDRVISPNEIYTEEFIAGLNEADEQLLEREYSEVRDFAHFVK